MGTYDHDEFEEDANTQPNRGARDNNQYTNSRRRSRHNYNRGKENRQGNDTGNSNKLQNEYKQYIDRAWNDVVKNGSNSNLDRKRPKDNKESDDQPKETRTGPNTITIDPENNKIKETCNAEITEIDNRSMGTVDNINTAESFDSRESNTTHMQIDNNDHNLNRNPEKENKINHYNPNLMNNEQTTNTIYESSTTFEEMTQSGW